MVINVLTGSRVRHVDSGRHGPRVRTYDRFQALPDSYDALFEQGATQSFCLTGRWFETLADQILNAGEKLSLVGVETTGSPPVALALMIGRESGRGGLLGRAHRFSSLSNYYSMVFSVLIAPDTDPALALRVLTKGTARRRPSYEILRFEGLDKSSPLFNWLADALRTEGFIVQSYFQCGNWYEATGGMTLAGYLAQRPSRLRNTFRRKGKALRDRGGELKIVTGGPDLDRGISDYEQVYAKSWQKYEPYPGVIRSLLRYCATEGALRLGLLYLNGEPIAGQIWIVWAGSATLYKLAHDRRFDCLSPGTVLTMRMIGWIFENDRVGEIDFGTGDDPYKSQWTSQRRERWGLVAFNPHTLHGALGGLRCVGGRWMKRLLTQASA